MDKQNFKMAIDWIDDDISRELELADASQLQNGIDALKSIKVRQGGGNFLSALGLLSYTEFGGKVKFGYKHANGSSYASKNFN